MRAILPHRVAPRASLDTRDGVASAPIGVQRPIPFRGGGIFTFTAREDRPTIAPLPQRVAQAQGGFSIDA
jgi:hypothetical protein